MSSELVPKKKFLFKNKVAKKDPVTDSKMEEEKLKEAEKMGFAVPNSPGFRNKTDKVWLLFYLTLLISLLLFG